MTDTNRRARGTRIVAGFDARVGYLAAASFALTLAFLPQTVFAQGAWPVAPASPNIIAVANLFWFMFAIAVVIFIGVEGSLFYAAFRFRRRPGVSAAQIHGSTRIEIIWTAIPALILAIIYFLTVQTMVTYSAPPGVAADPIHIKAIGHQWWWEFQYTDEGFSTANEIHVPAHTDVIVDVTTADVIHSFWLAQLAGKADANPGRVQTVWFNAQQSGVYEGKCAEFCGVSHAWMYFRVDALSPTDYQNWVKAEKTKPAPVSGLAAQGQQLYQSSDCGSCHAISGVSNGDVAPDLTHVASRWTIGAGVLDNTPENMYVWLENPQAVKPGVLMPNYRFSPDQLRALTAYMESLR
ncbi:MAG TPA: cytochrome c oxidase subunit II [Chloroflexota bacterium]|nr:cytochrome c oxidase subunit II [Chloroflexota bacterium]